MSVSAITPSQQARLDGTAKKKPSKTEKMKAAQAAMLARSETPAIEAVEDQKSAPHAHAPMKKEDQKSAKDQKGPKKKGISETVIKWRAQKKFELTQKIKLLKPIDSKPKRGKAMIRYSHYKDGMTISQYTEVLKKEMSRTPAQTMDDVRWDFVAGYISIH